jgi:uncharacterized protein (DUF983 family)
MEEESLEAPHFFILERVSDPQVGNAPASAAAVHLRSGDLCPQCQAGRLDYDGLLNLTCPNCGFSPGGGCFS